MRSWSWPKRSANSKPWDGQGSSCKSCCISYYGTLLQRPCFSRMHQHLSGDCGQPFLCGVPRHGCHPLCLGAVSLHGGLLSGTGRSAGISDRLLSPSHSGIGTPVLSYSGMAAVSAEYPHGRHDRADGANGLRFFLSRPYHLSFGTLYVLLDHIPAVRKTIRSVPEASASLLRLPSNTSAWRRSCSVTIPISG